MIFIQCKSAAIKLIIKRISRVFWFCYGSKLQKYQAPVAIKTQCRTKLLAFRLELKWRVWAERQSLALNYEFEWTERQTQLLLTSSVLKKKGFDWGMCKKGGGGGGGVRRRKMPKNGPRLFQNTNCGWVRICIQNKKEEVEWQYPIVPSLSDRHRHDDLNFSNSSSLSSMVSILIRLQRCIQGDILGGGEWRWCEWASGIRAKVASKHTLH